MFNKKRIHKMNPKRDTWNQPKSYHEEKKIYSLALVLDDEVVKKFVISGHTNSVMLAKYESWMDGTVVELGKENQILKFIPGKALTYEKTDSYYKTVNVYKFSKGFSVRHYIPFLEAYIKSFGTNLSNKFFILLKYIGLNAYNSYDGS